MRDLSARRRRRGVPERPPARHRVLCRPLLVTSFWLRWPFTRNAELHPSMKVGSFLEGLCPSFKTIFLFNKKFSRICTRKEIPQKKFNFFFWFLKPQFLFLFFFNVPFWLALHKKKSNSFNVPLIEVFTMIKVVR